MNLRPLLFGLVFPIVFLQGAYQMLGCGSSLRDLDQLSDPSDDDALRRCRNEARTSVDAGHSKQFAYHEVYMPCTVDAGLR